MIDANDKLCEVIGRNVDLLPIISRFGISANIGQATVEEICSIHRIDTYFLLSVLNTYDSPDYFPDTESINLNLLIGFLTETHQYHKRVTIPLLYKLMRDLKIRLPDTKMITTLEKYLNEYINKLSVHIEFEEKNIFPLVDKLTENKDEPGLKIAANHLKKLFSQHSNVETEISDLILIIIQHIPVDTDVQLFHDLLHTLSHFEKEQIDHARFEDKILVPRLLKSFHAKFGTNVV